MRVHKLHSCRKWLPFTQMTRIKGLQPKKKLLANRSQYKIYRSIIGCHETKNQCLLHDRVHWINQKCRHINGHSFNRPSIDISCSNAVLVAFNFTMAMCIYLQIDIEPPPPPHRPLINRNKWMIRWPAKLTTSGTCRNVVICWWCFLVSPSTLQVTIEGSRRAWPETDWQV